MNLLEQIIYALSGRMERPENYGWFHLMFIGIILLATVFLCLRFGKGPQKQEKTILLLFWGLILLLELYKQLQFSVNFSPEVSWRYRWYAFPFQFCSTPLYLLPVAALARNDRLRDAVRIFLASFALFAGIAVFVYPNDVFVETIGINIQTMVHHGTQIVLGVFLGLRLQREGKMTLRNFAWGCLVFAAMAAIALLLNLAAPLFTQDTFNMFYIGPRFPCTLVILDGFYAKLPYPLFLALYLLGFCFVAWLVFGLQKLLGRLARRPAKNALT